MISLTKILNEIEIVRFVTSLKQIKPGIKYDCSEFPDQGFSVDKNQSNLIFLRKEPGFKASTNYLFQREDGYQNGYSLSWIKYAIKNKLIKFA